MQHRLLEISPDLIRQRAKTAVTLLESNYKDDAPGVAYLIAHKGETIASGGIGMANLEWGIPLTEDSVLRLGSISKPITAVAILLLVEQGTLELDQPIATYAAKLPEQMQAVTLRQLLSHRSGLAEHAFDESLIPFIWQPMTTEKIIELQADKLRLFEPGEQYAYVNFNYVVAAHIVELVTGKTFVDFANSDIFAANGLANSHYDENDKIIPNRAEFYDHRDGIIINAADIDMSHVSAAGALLSSAKDISCWLQLLVMGKLITSEMLSEAWTPAPLPDGTPTEYGLGFNVSHMAGERLIWHTGLTPGGQAAFAYMPEYKLFVILLSNGFHLPRTGKLVDDLMMILSTGSQ